MNVAVDEITENACRSSNEKDEIIYMLSSTFHDWLDLTVVRRRHDYLQTSIPDKFEI